MKLRKSQRGAVALVVSLVLVFGMTLVAFFANRGMIFEQRTSANQVRSTTAFEVAEAGLDWALAMLNEPLYLQNAPSCTVGIGTVKQNFRERYLVPTGGATPGFVPVTTNPPRPGCSIAADGTSTCSCPTSGTNPTLGAATDPRFTVLFKPDPGGDPKTVEIIAYGCTSQGAPCDPGSTARPDGVAVVRTQYKVVPEFPIAPGAGLVAGATVVTGGNLKVINADPRSNGVTINSGTTVELGTGTDVVTLPGTPPRTSVLDNDTSLNALRNADASGDLFFQSFFGETMAQYRDEPLTWLITSGACGGRPRCTSCGSNNACGTAVSSAIDAGAMKFWTDTDVTFINSNLPTAGTLGTAARPVTIAGTGTLELRSNVTAYGMFYANSLTWDYAGSGNATVFGSFISRGNFSKGAGTLDLIYDTNIFANDPLKGLIVRVPGGWRDKETAY